MKHIILLTLAMLFGPAVQAHVAEPVCRNFTHVTVQGNSVGNGGDIIGAEFMEIARHLVDRLKRHAGDDVKYWAPLNAAVQNTVVRSESTVILNNLEVDAANYPACHLIIVDASRWKIKNDKTILILHEYLWMAGFDDSNYVISHRLARYRFRLPIPILM